MNLQPLHDALDHVEQAVADVVEKVGTAVTDTTSQSEVDQLVSRAEALAERLVGVQTPATQTSTTAAPADVAAPAGPGETTAGAPATPAPAAADTPQWTPPEPPAG